MELARSKFIIYSGLLTAIILTIFSINSSALVDMRTANYSASWTDIEIPGSAFDLRVVRTYNSRSLFNGMFGFGWCSDFETSLEITPEGSLRVRECGSGQTTFYSPQEVSKKDVEVAIEKIIKAKRNQKSSAVTEEYFTKLKKELYEDNTKRIQMAQELGIKAVVKPGTQYLANSKEVSGIVLEPEYYTRTLNDGTIQRFSLTGRLIAIYDKNKNFVKFTYQKDLLVEAEDNSNKKLSFKYYPNKKIKEIVGPKGSRSEYKFSNLEDLALVKNSWGNSFSYEYDDLHNLTKALWPDKTFIAIKYDKKRDWVTSFTDRERCVETYAYEFSATDPQMNYWANLKKVCGDRTVASNRYEFWHKQKSDGTYFLSRLKTNVDSQLTDIQYDDGFGKPISIRRNNQVYRFEYYPDGRVKTKTTAIGKMAFVYEGTNNRVTQVVYSFLNQKGEKIGSKESNFKYDTKGNLVSASNSEGVSVQVTYDERGRLASITDQSKKVVKIEYDEKIEKPHIVTRPGLGSIKLFYKSNGDIERVDSKEGGPSVALQIASTFNYLLDVLAPATQEVYN